MKTQNSLDPSDAERYFSPFLFHLKTVKKKKPDPKGALLTMDYKRRLVIYSTIFTFVLSCIRVWEKGQLDLGEVSSTTHAIFWVGR